MTLKEKITESSNRTADSLRQAGLLGPYGTTNKENLITILNQHADVARGLSAEDEPQIEKPTKMFVPTSQFPTTAGKGE